MGIDGTNQTFYCCGRCKGLWPIHRQLLKHRQMCIGDITRSDCDTFACEKSLYLKLFGIKNVEILEKTTTLEDIPLQRDLLDTHGIQNDAAMDDSCTAVQAVKTELVTSVESGVASVESSVASVESGVASVESGVASVESGVASVESGVASVESGVASVESGVASVESGVASVESGVASANVNMANEKQNKADSCETTPRRGCRRRVPRRWAYEDVSSSHRRHSKKQHYHIPHLKDISSDTITSREVLDEISCKDPVVKDTIFAPESSMPEIKMAETFRSTGSKDQLEHSNDTAVAIGSVEVGSVEQDNAAAETDHHLSDDETGQDSRVHDLCKEKHMSPAHQAEPEEGDDPTAHTHRQTTKCVRDVQQASFNQYVVVETQQMSSGKTSTLKLYKCPTCDWQTKHVGFFARHMRVSHDDGHAWKCSQCAFTCMSKKQMTKHKNLHSRPFLCDYCSVRYSEQRELERHIWKHKGEFPFCCSECDYKTRFSKALKEHVRKHTGEKLRCSEPDCDFATNYRYALSAHHAAKHTTEKRFSCAVCAYRTSDKGSFTKHTKLHLGVKNYKCGECDYRGVTRYDIVKHMRSHTKEKLYFCDRCDFATSYSSGLRLHLMSHLGVKPWQCSLCGYNSVTRSKIVRHIRQRHADSPQVGNVIDLGLKLDMRARDYRQRSRPPGQLATVSTTHAPAEEVQYELLEIPLTMLEGAEVSVKTTSGDVVADYQMQSSELSQHPQDNVFVGAELTLITTAATGCET